MKEFEKKIDRNEVALKKNNKGFSLVELIIVIAIMAILVGVVGTQVVPYIENSRQAKDYQQLSSLCTAATSAYSTKAAYLTNNTSTITITLSDPATTHTDDNLKVLTEFKNLTGYDALPAFKNGMESKAGKSISLIVITINQSSKEITVTPTYDTTNYPGAFPDIKGKL